MQLRIILKNSLFSVAEISAMQLDGDLLDYHQAYVPLDYLDSPDLRALYLKLKFRPNAKATGLALEWVKKGGQSPTEFYFESSRLKSQ